jgi:hypothetical protein
MNVVLVHAALVHLVLTESTYPHGMSDASCSEENLAFRVPLHSNMQFDGDAGAGGVFCC